MHIPTNSRIWVRIVRRKIRPCSLVDMIRNPPFVRCHTPRCTWPGQGREGQIEGLEGLNVNVYGYE
eukprot:378673-Amorphochlora_amoeboformis.AAC.1